MGGRRKRRCAAAGQNLASPDSGLRENPEIPFDASNPGALHRTLRRGAGRVRSGVSSSLKITNTPQRALAAANKCAPSSRCGFFQTTEAASTTSLPAEAPRDTSLERGFPERFATLIRTRAWQVEGPASRLIRKSDAWPDQPRPLFVISKRALNNRPWAGLLSCLVFTILARDTR